MKILVDADVLVAVVKMDDTNHAKAVKITEKIQQDELYLSPFTIPEAATVLSHKVSQEKSVLFLKEVRAKKLTVLALDEKIVKTADDIFAGIKTQKTSWPDCLNVALIQLYKIDSIFSFDSFYRKFHLNYIS